MFGRLNAFTWKVLEGTGCQPLTCAIVPALSQWGQSRSCGRRKMSLQGGPRWIWPDVRDLPCPSRIPDHHFLQEMKSLEEIMLLVQCRKICSHKTPTITPWTLIFVRKGILKGIILSTTVVLSHITSVWSWLVDTSISLPFVKHLGQDLDGCLRPQQLLFLFHCGGY